jgi:hypothetical protein
MELKFSQQFSQQYWNIKINANPYSGSKVVLCGQTDGRTDRQRHDNADSCFSNFTHTPKKGAAVTFTQKTQSLSK